MGFKGVLPKDSSIDKGSAARGVSSGIGVGRSRVVVVEREPDWLVFEVAAVD
jgi:hypothetical protein